MRERPLGSSGTLAVEFQLFASLEPCSGFLEIFWSRVEGIGSDRLFRVIRRFPAFILCRARTPGMVIETFP